MYFSIKSWQQLVFKFRICLKNMPEFALYGYVIHWWLRKNLCLNSYLRRIKSTYCDLSLWYSPLPDTVSCCERIDCFSIAIPSMRNLQYLEFIWKTVPLSLTAKSSISCVPSFPSVIVLRECMCRDYVFSWYSKLSSSQQFPGEVRTCLGRVVSILAEKIGEVGPQPGPALSFLWFHNHFPFSCYLPFSYIFFLFIIFFHFSIIFFPLLFSILYVFSMLA
jgi:hypothetical protein